MCFSLKTSNFWLFFVNNLQNLRLCEKTEKVFLELTVFYLKKVTIYIFLLFFELFDFKKM